MKIESLRSPYQKVGGLYHFARMLDKIRLHQAGKLPAEHHPNFGLSVGLDGHLCSFLGVEFAAVCERVRQGGTDDEIAEWCFQHGLRPNKMQTRIWNEFARPGARVARLHRGHRVAQPHGLHQLPRGGFGISPAQVGARAGLSPEKNFGRSPAIVLPCVSSMNFTTRAASGFARTAAHGNENWEFDDLGYMKFRYASINDQPIAETERKFRWERKL